MKHALVNDYEKLGKHIVMYGRKFGEVVDVLKTSKEIHLKKVEKVAEEKMDNKVEIQKLIEARKLSTSDEYTIFEDALNALQGKISIDDVSDICRAFYDDTQDDEMMFGIIHLIEKLCGKDYLKEIAICTPAMKDAHNWAMILNKRIINSQEYFAMYIEVIRSLESESKNKIVGLLNDVKNDNPNRFSEKIEYLNSVI